MTAPLTLGSPSWRTRKAGLWSPKDGDFRDSHLLTGSPQRLLIVATANITNAALMSRFETHLDAIAAALQETDFVEVERLVGDCREDRAHRPGHQHLREALEIIRLLWQGGYCSYDGKHLQLEDARVFDLPEQLPVIAVAASGPASARIAAELGDGLFATEPKGDLVDTWRRLGGSGPLTPRCRWPGRLVRIPPRRRCWRKAAGR